MNKAPPSITVVIPTCNRTRDVKKCLDSLTKVTYPDWTVLLIDQSDDSSTELLAKEFEERLPAFTCWRMVKKGAASARNLAMSRVESDILAFLDDDCTIDSSLWLQDIAATFDRHPDAELIFGSVLAAPHDHLEYYVDRHEVQDERILRGRLAVVSLEGIMAASMYLRRSLARSGIPIDIHTGAGADLAFEDCDYAYRVLATGHTVIETPAIRVTHHGARDYKSGAASRMLRRISFSRGAMYTKFLRCGDPAALVLLGYYFVGTVRRVDLRQLVVRRRAPTHLAWPVYYVRGLLAGFRRPIIRRYALWGHLDEYEQWTFDSTGQYFRACRLA